MESDVKCYSRLFVSGCQIALLMKLITYKINVGTDYFWRNTRNFLSSLRNLTRTNLFKLYSFNLLFTSSVFI